MLKDISQRTYITSHGHRQHDEDQRQRHGKRRMKGGEMGDIHNSVNNKINNNNNNNVER